MSFSPVGDILVIARERNIVVLSCKCSSNSDLNRFEVIFSGAIHEYDKIKAVLCIPFGSLSGGYSSYLDWTCILVAFDSGFVRFFTEECQYLFEEQFHNENIIGIKCQSQYGRTSDLNAILLLEQIFIQYQSVLVVLDGLTFFPILRKCRSKFEQGKFKLIYILIYVFCKCLLCGNFSN